MAELPTQSLGASLRAQGYFCLTASGTDGGHGIRRIPIQSLSAAGRGESPAAALGKLPAFPQRPDRREVLYDGTGFVRLRVH